MTFDVTVAVATFGDWHWHRLASERAVPSAQRLGVPVIQHHVEPPAGIDVARNEALAQVRTEWVIHLDADDELEPGYVEAMAQGSADVRVPRVRYIRPHASYVRRQMGQHPTVLHVAGHRGQHPECDVACLSYGNWVIVGAAVRTEIARRAGGWRDWPWSEDWDFWLRCRAAGASFELVHGAVYRAHIRRGSRNRSMTRDGILNTHRAIAAANGITEGI